MRSEGQESFIASVKGYALDTLKDASGYDVVVKSRLDDIDRYERSGVELADMTRGDLFVIGSSAAVRLVHEVAFPIWARGSRKTEEEVEKRVFESKVWLGYPASIGAEALISIGGYVITKESGGTFLETAEIFSGIKAIEIAIATVGRDVFNYTRAKIGNGFNR